MASFKRMFNNNFLDGRYSIYNNDPKSSNLLVFVNLAALKVSLSIIVTVKASTVIINTLISPI